MKKPNNKNNSKIETLRMAINASLNEPYLLKDLVESLADRRPDIGYSLEKVQLGWKALETSSLEAHVSGRASISNEADSVNMLFTTCFLFTCTKAKRQNYSLTWVNSLS
jgi:hypothetical protein